MGSRLKLYAVSQTVEFNENGIAMRTEENASNFETTISGYSNMHSSSGFWKVLWFLLSTLGGWLTFNQVSLEIEKYFTYPIETKVIMILSEKALRV